MRFTFAAAAALAALCVCSPSVRAAHVGTDFESNPETQGWSKSGTASWSTAQANSGTHSLHVLGASSSWTSPAIPLTPQQFVQIDFKTLGSGATTTVARYQLQPSTDWRDNRIMGRASNGQTSFRLGLPGTAAGYYVDDFSTRTATSAEVATWADSVYDEIRGPAQIKLGTTANSSSLTRTAAALREGRPLRVVMLGDSIVNDSGLSPFDTLVERRFPGADLEVILSVRDGTGMSYYQHDATANTGVERQGVARVQSYVLDYDPDLVMIGGISNGTDEAAYDAIRSVVDQIQAGGDADILLMSDTLGGLNPDNPYQFEVDPNGTGYRSRLLQIAREQGVAFVDMAGPYLQFIDDSGRPVTDFKRDGLHGNHFGQQVVARTLDSYFASVVPEPTCLFVVPLAALLLRRPRRGH